MELLILDRALKPLGILDGYAKCCWDRRYWETGRFEVETDFSFYPLLRQGCYLLRRDTGEAGVVQAMGYLQGPEGARTVTLSGCLTEGLLGRWVIRRQVQLSGTGEQICRELVRLCCMEEGREFPGLVFGPEAGLGEPVEVQYQGENLLEQSWALLREQGLSQELRLLPEEKQFVYRVWAGVDRRAEQTERPPVIFSTGWETLLTDDCHREDSDYRNVAYVQGADRPIVIGGEVFRVPGPTVEVDLSEGEERRELWVNGTGIRWEKETLTGEKDYYTTAQYEAMLRQAGKEALAVRRKKVWVNSLADPWAQVRYREHWDLGDLVTYENPAVGLSLEQRVTRVVERWDGAGERVEVTFGERQPDAALLELRKEAGKR